MSSTVKSVAHVHAADIDTTVVKSGVTWEGLANVCVSAAERALETPPKGYTPMRRNSLADVFASMKVTHRSIRLLVALGDEKPESVDALVLARLQLEGLYTLFFLESAMERCGRSVTVTFYGNILHRWASIGEAGTSSSRGKAITRRGMCTFIATAS